MPLINVYNTEGNTDQGAFDFEKEFFLTPATETNPTHTIVLASYEHIADEELTVKLSTLEGDFEYSTELTQEGYGLATAELSAMYIQGDGEVNQIIYPIQWSIHYKTTEIFIDASNCWESEEETIDRGYEGITHFYPENYDNNPQNFMNSINHPIIENVMGQLETLYGNEEQGTEQEALNTMSIEQAYDYLNTYVHSTDYLNDYLVTVCNPDVLNTTFEIITTEYETDNTHEAPAPNFHDCHDWNSEMVHTTLSLPIIMNGE